MPTAAHRPGCGKPQRQGDEHNQLGAPDIDTEHLDGADAITQPLDQPFDTLDAADECSCGKADGDSNSYGQPQEGSSAARPERGAQGRPDTIHHYRATIPRPGPCLSHRQERAVALMAR